MCWNWHHAFHMHRENLRKLDVNARHKRNKNDILLAFDLDTCEGVGEDSGHGIGDVDIQVGSCNCLNVFVLPCMRT